MGEEVFAEELRFFNENRAEWLKEHKGKFALVKGKMLLGFFDSADGAYSEGLKQLGNVPMLVIQVLPEQPVDQFPALQLGLVHANF